MAKVKILTSAALYFIAFWTLGVDLMMIRLPPRGFKDKTPVGSITMNNHALLDMAPNSIDDYYKGCRPKMKKMVKKEYLVQERQNNDAFNQAWASAEDYYQKKKRSYVGKGHCGFGGISFPMMPCRVQVPTVIFDKVVIQSLAPT
ncbi:hypothetical protein DPEC_G00184700 [Dallia pectoralis]|uniref:Uncharacterized protein n=1 Tax=Dallia pectoralis TaxID=75939 RepID=A0ACC2GAX7_DALPE|nr:hypothetical protein DPEC_G00184700 [Dallia pectoralis]